MRQDVRLGAESEKDKSILDILDYDTLRRGSDNSMAATRLFMEAEKTLLKEHPGKWVVFSKDGQEAMADSIEEALALSDAKGLWRPEVIVHYLDPDPDSIGW